MSEPMTDEELQSFYEYAGANMVEPDGSQCQWADYSTRCVDEIRRLREDNTRQHEWEETILNLVKELRKKNERLTAGYHRRKDELDALYKENERLRLKISEFIDGENRGPHPDTLKYDALREENERLRKFNKRAEDIFGELHNVMTRAGFSFNFVDREQYERARELLEEWCKAHKGFNGPPYRRTRAFLDGEEEK